MTSPSTEAGQNDGWVMVNEMFATKGHTRSRTPQYNGDNESCVQVAAGASAENALTDNEGDFGSGHIVDDDRSYTPHKPESNGSSTETGSGATLTVDNVTGQVRTAMATSIYPATTPNLTLHTLEKHQRELEQGYSSHVAGWVAGAGIGGLLTRHLTSSTQLSIMVRTSQRSIASSTKQDRLSDSPPSAGVEDIVAAGSWCDPSIDPVVRASPFLDLNDE
ncbi:hypothetical protein B0T17DRAFT_618565 [Bombardia bombarda]|uniref:Uncharacterized protein n=1 Tax=Bombardia bombarda TaxID=252184 RepID=A0AA39WM33_9PEZI|nr:hypothetical protein B0T17DRAFT_618565 [Bombardia bombarda]